MITVLNLDYYDYFHYTAIGTE